MEIGTRARHLAATIATTALLGCSQPQSAPATESGTATPAQRDAAATTGEPKPETGEGTPQQDLPPGVLARTEGKQGVIQVEERDGLRLLTIGGTTHGAIPIGAATVKLAGDQAVLLVRTLRPEAKTALVIGLGTGKTARELEAAGLIVETVELEPAVVEYARKYFDYKGHAAVDDGIAYLEKKEKTWDVVVMDAAAGINPPPRLVSADAIALLRRRTSKDGLTVLRKYGEPQDYVTKMIARRLEAGGAGRRALVHVFGSGVGPEIQNLYFLASGKALNLVNVSGLAMWPILLMDMAPQHGIPTPVDARTAEPALERRVRLVGYLHFVGADRAMALDLPHWEMGAVRYLLSGVAAGGLRGTLPKKAQFPTEGDIGTDGDTSKTLKEVLGGGGSKRSDVRFSSVIVALEGTAKLRSVIHPDAAGRLPPSIRGDAELDDRLPYGGALYDLEVSKVVWTLDRDGWRKLAKRLRPFANGAEKRIRAGALSRAAKELDGYGKALEGKMLTLLPQYTEMQLLAEKIARAGAALGAKPSRFAIAAACDRTAEHAKPYEIVSTDVARLRAALTACAEANYDRVTKRGKDPRAKEAAARLLVLWERLGYSDDVRVERAYKKKLAGLRRQYPALQPAKHPPGEEAPQ